MVFFFFYFLMEILCLFVCLEWYECGKDMLFWFWDGGRSYKYSVKWGGIVERNGEDLERNGLGGGEGGRRRREEELVSELV